MNRIEETLKALHEAIGDPAPPEIEKLSCLVSAEVLTDGFSLMERADESSILNGRIVTHELWLGMRVEATPMFHPCLSG